MAPVSVKEPHGMIGRLLKATVIYIEMQSIKELAPQRQEKTKSVKEQSRQQRGTQAGTWRTQTAGKQTLGRKQTNKKWRCIHVLSELLENVFFQIQIFKWLPSQVGTTTFQVAVIWRRNMADRSFTKVMYCIVIVLFPLRYHVNQTLETALVYTLWWHFLVSMLLPNNDITYEHAGIAKNDFPTREVGPSEEHLNAA